MKVKTVKQNEAQERSIDRTERTDEEQIARLEMLGHRGCKEWRRLMVKTGKAID